MDAEGRILSGQLVEFVAPDLDASLFRDYVTQWLVGDFGNRQILVAEYTIGYASTKTLLYEPGKDPQPIDMVLREIHKSGKAQAKTYFCWVSDYVRGGDVCVGDSNEGCTHIPAKIEITCVCTSGCGGDGGDDGGSGGGGGPGGSGGGNSGSKDGVQFELNCGTEVTRGEQGSCTVTATKAGNNVTGQYTYSWSSSIGAKASTTGSSWKGRATSDAYVTVSVDSDTLSWSTGQTISVSARSGWRVTPLSASPIYRYMENFYGLYVVYKEPSEMSSPYPGTGPWKGDFMTSQPPEIPAGLFVHSDFSSAGAKYSGANKTCVSSETGLGSSENTYTVNKYCGSLSVMESFVADVIRHEKFHEAGYNACLSGSKGQKAMTEMEGITGTEVNVKAKWEKAWSEFYKGHFLKSGKAGNPVTSISKVWNHFSGRWEFAILGGAGHPPGDPFGC